MKGDLAPRVFRLHPPLATSVCQRDSTSFQPEEPSLGWNTIWRQFLFVASWPPPVWDRQGGQLLPISPYLSRWQVRESQCGAGGIAGGIPAPSALCLVLRTRFLTLWCLKCAVRSKLLWGHTVHVNYTAWKMRINTWSKREESSPFLKANWFWNFQSFVYLFCQGTCVLPSTAGLAWVCLKIYLAVVC